MSAALIPQDRSLVLSRRQVIRTGWVAAHRVRLACTERMAVGDVERAHSKALANGDATWPPPVGYWEKESFVLTDGRHEFVARLMLGQREMFVAWVEEEAR